MKRLSLPARWFIALMLLLTLAGMHALPSSAESLPIPTPTPVEVPDVDVPLPTVPVPLPTVAVPTVAVPPVEVPPVTVPTVEVPVDGLPVDDLPVDIQDPAGQSTDAIGAEAVDATVALTITVINCGVDVALDADAVVLGSLDATALLALGCAPADGVAISVIGDADADLGGGTTVAGNLVVPGLTAGATVTVTEDAPDGFLALTASQSVVAAADLGLLFVNVDAEADVTADLGITKISCGADVALDADAVVLGTLDAEALLDLGCTLTSDVAFAVMGGGDVLLGDGLTVDGRLTVKDLALGATVTVTEMVPAGSIALTPSQVAVLVPGLDLLFVNVDADADIDVDLAITKINCGADVELDAEANLPSPVDVEALLELGCELADDVAFTVTAEGGTVLGDGLTADGLVTIDGIELGALVTVRETVPSGFTALTEAQAVVALPGLNLLFVNVESGGSATATATPNAATRTAISATETAISATETAISATETAISATQTAISATETARATGTPDAATETAIAATETGATSTPSDSNETPVGGVDDSEPNTPAPSRTATPDGGSDDDPDGDGDGEDVVVVTALPNTGAGGGGGGLGTLLAAILMAGAVGIGFLNAIRRRRGAGMG